MNTNAACSTLLCSLSPTTRIAFTSGALRTIKQIHETSALTNSALIIHKPWCVDSAKRTQLKDLTYRETKELLATVNVDNFRFAREDDSATEDTITFSEVAILSKVALDALFEAWTQLRNIVTQKETTSIKRWSGKSASQKKAVLLKAWPGMPLVRRPDFQVLRAQKISGIATIHALQFPHINVEDLTKQKNLLISLKHQFRPLRIPRRPSMHCLRLGRPPQELYMTATQNLRLRSWKHLI